nr:transposase [Paracoccus halophilus]
MDRKKRGRPELFISVSPRDLIPDDHVLVRVDQLLDPEWLRAGVTDLYRSNNDRPGLDPELALRLMLAGFPRGIVHDRRLMREARVNLAIRRVFVRVLRQCQVAELVSTGIIHIDASPIRADVSMDALVSRHLDAIEDTLGASPDRITADAVPSCSSGAAGFSRSALLQSSAP